MDTETRLDAYLIDHRGTARYLVAVQGSQQAEGIILATGDPVMAMGGFSGTDPWPTLAAFKKMVTAGEVRYVLIGGGGFGGRFGASAGPGGFGGPSASGPVAPAAGLSALGGVGGAPSGGQFPGGGGFPGGGFPGGGFPGGGFPGSSGGPGAGGSGGGSPGSSSAVAAVDQWVEAHGTVVSSTKDGATGSGTLYLVSPKEAG